MRLLLPLALLTAACSSDPEPIDCDIAEVDGVYYFDWTRIDGNCDIDDGLRPFTLAGVDEGCAAARDVDDCRVTEVAECQDGVTVVSVVDQLDDDGGRIKGTLTINDPSECSGTLKFEATRQ